MERINDHRISCPSDAESFWYECIEPSGMDQTPELFSAIWRETDEGGGLTEAALKRAMISCGMNPQDWGF